MKRRTRWTWLTTVLLWAALASAQDDGLTCPDERQQLATRVIQCWAQPRGRATPSNQSVPDLLEKCFTSAGQEIKVITLLMPIEGKLFLAPLLEIFQRESGLQFAVIYKVLNEVSSELKFSASRGVSNVYNIFAASSLDMAELNGLKLFQDLGPFVNTDASGVYQNLWQEFHPFFRQNLAIQGGKIASLPLASSVPYMYWRTDVFARYNLSVPNTWEEVIEVALFLNRTNWDPRVRKKIPICFPKPLISDLGRAGNGAYLFTSILGSMVQYKGKVQGLLYDPVTMKPLVNNAAMARALELYSQLAAFYPDITPDGRTDDPYSQTMLTNGYCALGFRWAESFKMSAYSAYLKGNMGISITPGSTYVWDRATDTLRNCTAALCIGSDAIQRRDPATGRNVTLHVNRVPYAALASYGVGVNAYSARGYQEAAYQTITYISSALLSTDALVYSPLAPIGPIKTKQLAMDAAALALWPGTYNRSDIRAYIAATLAVIAHPNTLVDLKMPSQTTVQAVMDDAARLVERDGVTAINSIMLSTYQRLSDITTQFVPGGLPAFRSIYWEGIGYAPAPTPPAPPSGDDLPPPPVASGPSSAADTVGLAVGVAVPIFILLSAVVAGTVLIRRRAKHRTLMGHVVPPGLGPLTTLLVTDIQSSTSLWDCLPQDVMESSVALHYQVLRRVAHANQGYESAAEGDSIILGFHTPLDATRAAVQAQAELLAADWPAGLLAHDLCAPKYALPVACMDQAEGDCSQLQLPPFPLWDSAPPAGASGRFVSDRPLDAIEQQPNSSWTSCCSSLSRLWRSSRTPPPAFLHGTSPTSLYSSTLTRVFGGGTKSSVMAALGVGAEVAGAGAQEEAGSSTSVREYLASTVVLAGEAQGKELATTLIFRGLRVRIGVHTGVEEASAVIINRRTGRPQYAGQPLAMATAVSSAGHGGMVLMSEDTFSQLDGQSLAQSDMLLASMGLSQLLDMDYPIELYQTLTHQLAYRMCFVNQLRYSQQLSPSFLDAPYDRITVCYMHAVGLAALNAWSPNVTQDSIQVYQNVATSELEKHGGYLVNSSAGLMLAAFKDPAHAIRWALCSLQHCLEADWDPALLEHELGEEVVVGHNVTSAEAPPEIQKDVDLVSMTQTLTDAMGSGGGGGTAHVGGTGGERSSVVRTSNDVRGSSATNRSDQLPRSQDGSPHVSGGSRQQVGLVKTVTRKTLLFRGLRLKCAVDVGQAKASIEPSTGRVTYFGRVMNRCARVSAMIKTGQVWCTNEVWDAAMSTINSYEAISLEAAHWQDRDSEQRKAGSGGGRGSNRNTPFPFPDQARPAAAATAPCTPHAEAQPATPFANENPWTYDTDKQGAVKSPTATVRPLNDTAFVNPGSLGSPAACATEAPQAPEASQGAPKGAGLRRSITAGALSVLQDDSSDVPVVSVDPVDSSASLKLIEDLPTTGTFRPAYVSLDGRDASDPPRQGLRALGRAASMGGQFKGRKSRLSQSGAGFYGSGAEAQPTQPKQPEDAMSAPLPMNMTLAIASQGSPAPSIVPASIAGTGVILRNNILAQLSSMRRPNVLLVAGIPLGRCKLRGIQESVGLVQCRFDDQSVVQVAKAGPGGGFNTSLLNTYDHQNSNDLPHSHRVSPRASPRASPRSSRASVRASPLQYLSGGEGPSATRSLPPVAGSIGGHSTPRFLDGVGTPGSEESLNFRGWGVLGRGPSAGGAARRLQLGAGGQQGSPGSVAGGSSGHGSPMQSGLLRNSRMGKVVSFHDLAGAERIRDRHEQQQELGQPPPSWVNRYQELAQPPATGSSSRPVAGPHASSARGYYQGPDPTSPTASFPLHPTGMRGARSAPKQKRRSSGVYPNLPSRLSDASSDRQVSRASRGNSEDAGRAGQVPSADVSFHGAASGPVSSNHVHHMGASVPVSSEFIRLEPPSSPLGRVAGGRQGSHTAHSPRALDQFVRRSLPTTADMLQHANEHGGNRDAAGQALPAQPSVRSPQPSIDYASLDRPTQCLIPM